jgi:hypothetical protein
VHEARDEPAAAAHGGRSQSQESAALRAEAEGLSAELASLDAYGRELRQASRDARAQLWAAMRFRGPGVAPR